MRLLQVTLGSGATPLVTQQAGGTPTQLYIAFQQLLFQNNATHSVRVGDASVSATRGLLLLAGGSLNISPNLEYSGDLSEFYLYGTAGDVIDLMLIE